VSDWTAAFHCGLVESQRCCTACGSDAQPAYYHVVEVGTLALAIRHCNACRAADPQLTQVLALLRARYERGEGGTR
jgi:hypothetical protein